MPGYFQLFPIGSTEAATLQSINEAICEHFNAPVDPKEFYYHWFYAIGVNLAMGETFDEIIAYYEREDVKCDDIQWCAEMAEIAKFLQSSYSPRSLDITVAKLARV